jgi:hypothetical protein
MSELMNLENLRAKLVSAARRHPPDARVPYAFEKRIMARLAPSRPEDLWSLWGTALWKGAAACAAVTVLSILLSFWNFRPSDETSDQSLESVVLAGADQMTDSW